MNGIGSSGRPWWIVATQLRSGNQRRWLSLIATSGTSRMRLEQLGHAGDVEAAVERRDHRRLGSARRTRSRGSPCARGRCRTGAPRATRPRSCAACSSRRRRGSRSARGSARRSGSARTGRPSRRRATSVTSWPRRCSSSPRAATTRSVPAYVGGGTGSIGGATSSTRRRSRRTRRSVPSRDVGSHPLHSTIPGPTRRS